MWQVSFWKTEDGDVEFFNEQDGCNSTSIVHSFWIYYSVYLEMNGDGRLRLKWEEDDKERERILARSKNDIAKIITWLIRTYKKLY